MVEAESVRILGLTRETLLEGLAEGAVGHGFPELWSNAVDAYFSARLVEYAANGSGLGDANPGATTGEAFALVAVGGYGRGELCPHSDLDVLVVHADGAPEGSADLARFLFFPLWDMGLDLGHGVRTIDDCLKLSGADMTVLCSFLDARLLAGSAGVFEVLAARLGEEVFAARAADCARFFESRNLERKARHGEAGAMLEPNLKDGPGGLRDAHQIHWLSRLAAHAGRQGELPDEVRGLAGRTAFTTLARCHLHQVSGRKNDRLYFEYQEKLAARLGFADQGHALGVERFLAALLRRMSELDGLRESLWPVLVGAAAAGRRVRPRRVAEGVLLGGFGLELARKGPDQKGRADRDRLMALFQAAARLGRPLSHAARVKAHGEAPALGRELAADPRKARRTFAALLGILAADVGGQAAAAMSDTGVLEAVVPEFARVRDLVKFDLYHVHPVGRHSLETARELALVLADRTHAQHPIMAGLARRDVLFAAALLHDIGKGLGGDHSGRGAAIVAEMLFRYGLDEDAARDVVFLVREHLVLTETATGRDLSDRNILAALAGRIGTAERLDMLYLLTYADARATGPSAWTGWRESLVGELYRKLSDILRGGGLFDAHDAHVMLVNRDRVRALGLGRLDADLLERRLDHMPPRYLITLPAETIVAHLAMLDELDRDIAEDMRRKPSGRGGVGVIRLSARPAPGGAYELTVAARGARTLFAVVAGVMALYDLSILSADVFVWDDGTAVHVLRLSQPPDPLYADELFERVRRAVSSALTGRLSLDYRLARKRGGFLAAAGRGPKGPPPEVAIDNAASELSSVIEVTADDRVGLLYDLARTLAELRLDVHLAKVDTPGGRARDVFYVRGHDGAKLTETEHIEEIRAALVHCLGE